MYTSWLIRLQKAGVTQLVESQPSKLLVASSSLVSRSIFPVTLRPAVRAYEDFRPTRVSARLKKVEQFNCVVQPPPWGGYNYEGARWSNGDGRDPQCQWCANGRTHCSGLVPKSQKYNGLMALMACDIGAKLTFVSAPGSNKSAAITKLAINCHKMTLTCVL